MKPRLAFLTRTPFHVLLFTLGCLLLCWPLLSIVAGQGFTALYGYFFLTWGVLILALALIGLALGRHASGEDREDV